MLAATFCLSLGGDTPSRKSTFDAIQAQCIPVLFSFGNDSMVLEQLPFRGRIPWPQLVLLLPLETLTDAGTPSVVQQLRAVPQSIILSKQDAIRRWGPMLRYTYGTSPQPAVQASGGGAVQMALQALAYDQHEHASTSRGELEAEECRQVSEGDCRQTHRISAEKPSSAPASASTVGSRGHHFTEGAPPAARRHAHAMHSLKLHTIYWLHFPKTSSLFATTVLTHACGTDRVPLARVSQLTVSGPGPQRSDCGGLLSQAQCCGNKHSAWFHDPLPWPVGGGFPEGQSVVFMVREPTQRALSAFAYLHKRGSKCCGPGKVSKS